MSELAGAPAGPNEELSMAASPLTLHAKDRARSRMIPESAVDAALSYGSHSYARGADQYIIGWRDVEFWAKRGVDLERFRGVKVICRSDGRVLTTYRKRRPGRVGRQRSAARRRCA